jgi:4-hydroxy-tetrahydrodipicolinate synthase
MYKGSIVALITPFTEHDKVDYQAIHDLVFWHVESGTDGILLCGTTGEAPTLSEEEQIQIFKTGISASKGRIPIYAGTGSYNTQNTIALTEAAQKAGADGALVVIPYYSRPTPEGCFQHFQLLSKIGLPLIVYHHPGRIGMKLTVKELCRIAELPHIAAIKDSTADLDYCTELVQRVNLPVLTGDDGLILPTMAIGGSGVISVVANLIPVEWKQLTTLLLQEKWEEGRALFYRFFPLVKSMFLETNPQCVKYAMGALGKCSLKMRLPLVQPQEVTQRQILSELINIGLLLKDSNKVYN